MKAISIKQPWAWLIINGHKDIENRSWATRFRGKVLIHAGKKFDDDFMGWGLPDIARAIPPEKELEYGGIVGMAEIVDCVDKSDSPWFFGDYGFVIGRARTLPFMPIRGQLGFFDVEYDKSLLKQPQPEGSE